MEDYWKKWIIDNIAKGTSTESLLLAMGKEGLGAAESQAAIDEVLASPYLTSLQECQAKLRKREWMLETLDWHQRHLEGYTKPKKVPLPPFKDFLQDYYYANRIGIFSGAIDHWGASKWEMQDMVDIVGYDSIVEVQKGREKVEDYEIRSVSLKRDVKFGEFIDFVTSNDSSNDMYMTANNQPFKNPAMEKLIDGFGDIGDGYFDMDKFKNNAFLWIGPKGVITPLHHDLTNNFFVQVSGKKLYHLIPPMQTPLMYDSNHVFSDINLLQSDLDKFPEFKKASVIEVELDPGDCLFIPIGCWHHVVGLTQNISLTFTNLNVQNKFPGFSEGK